MATLAFIPHQGNFLDNFRNLKVTQREYQTEVNNGKSTAILLFARSAASETHHKTFLKHTSSKREVLVATALISQARQTCLHSGLPLFTCSDQQQVGHSFGERLANAVEDVFSRGFDKVITIGSDTPSLNHIHIRKAKDLLTTADMVFGPSSDGGVYLIGMSKEAYCRPDFLKLPWLSEHLHDAFQAQADQGSFSHSSLEELHDIDREVDLLYALRDQKLSQSFTRLIYQLIGLQKFNTCTDFSFSSLFTPASALLRAPPGR